MASAPSFSPRRRDLLLAGGALLLPWGAFAARGPSDDLVVLLIQRGAADGLAIAAPIGDPDYHRLRGGLALPDPGQEGGVLPLVDGFGLHPKLAFLHDRFTAGELAFLHAASTPYRDRSHFDAQDVLESGTDQVFGGADGWLSRALAVRGGTGVSVGNTVPLVLRGPGTATSWTPSNAPAPDDDTLARLADLYAGDDELSADLAEAVRTAAMLGEGARGRNGGWKALAQSAAKLLVAPDGPIAAVLSLDGWDTHANQGTVQGTLAGRLAQLDEAVQALKEGLGDAWSRTTVVMATEFGRTVAVNGTAGSDHGTGALALVVGGRVRGGRRLGDWPTLAKLYQDRDLQPANDVRSLFAAVLRDAWKVEDGVFDGVRPLPRVLA